MLQKPIPTPVYKPQDSPNNSNNHTIVTSNTIQAVCDRTHDNNAAKNDLSMIPAGVCIVPSRPHATTNKIAEKWKRKIVNQVKRKMERASMTPRAKTKDAIWKQIISEGGIHHSANAVAMLDTKNVVRQVQYALSDLGASPHF